ncbi:FkbM family methyltransferase [Nostoc sp.]|uniref:FkbM family methyltransferase n=1 Tax=Nostoc sp. TaxID=1180 RepID=UPI003FA5B205
MGLESGKVEQNLQQINLSKIDVEKSELEVFLGVKEHNWLKIKPIVVKVHNINERLKEIGTWLQNQLFNKILVDQEPLFINSNNLYFYIRNKI